MRFLTIAAALLIFACASSPVPAPSPVLAPVPTTISLLPVAAENVTLIATVLDQYGRGLPGVDVWFSVDTVKHITDAYGAASYTIASPPRPLMVRATVGLLTVDAYISPIILPIPNDLPSGYEPPPPVQPLPSSNPAPCDCSPLPSCCPACNHYTSPLIGVGDIGVPT